MRVGSDLKTKAFLALEEAVHESRYRRVERSRALGFALAYLWGLARTDVRPFTTYWREIASDNPVFRFGMADRALEEIYLALKVKRDDDLSHEIWSEVQRRVRRDPPSPDSKTA